jgi:hypothetical protein
MNTEKLSVKRTDWYEIVPLPSSFFALIVEDEVKEVALFPDIDAAEDYILLGGLS